MEPVETLETFDNNDNNVDVNEREPLKRSGRINYNFRGKWGIQKKELDETNK